MTAPTVPASHTDLLEANIAILATIGSDGRPQTSAVWFLNVDGVVKMSLNTARQKTKNMIANPAVSVLILDLANPARYLEIRGDVTIEPDDDYVFGTVLGTKYGMPDVSVMDKPGEHRTVVTVNPVRIHAINMAG
jgi:PPOX class probable F420-dependent enzyme